MREWIRISQQTDGPCRRYGHTLTSALGSVYMFGGFMSEGLVASRMNDLWELNPGIYELLEINRIDNVSASLKWKQIHPEGSVLPPKLYAHTTVAVGDDELLIFGGIMSAPSSSIVLYDIGE